MTKLIKREVILVKIESTPGADAVPVAANDSVLVENISWSHANARMIERKPVKATLGQLQPIYAGTLMEMSFDVELKYSGTAGTPPEVDPCLRACGIGVTNVVSTSDTYAGISTAHEYVTIYYYEDGGLYKMTGCQGDLKIAAATGEIGKLSFTFLGHVSGPTDVTLVTGVYDSAVPAPFIGATFVAGGYAGVISALNFELGNQVVAPVSANAPDGYSLMKITDRTQGGSFDPEATTVAAKDWMGIWKAGTVQSIGTGVIGPSAGNRWALTMATSYYKELGPGDRDGIRTLDIGMACAGDDAAFSLAFT